MSTFLFGYISYYTLSVRRHFKIIAVFRCQQSVVILGL